VGPLFLIATELSAHDAAWPRAQAVAATVAGAAAPILGFDPDVRLASLASEGPGPGGGLPGEAVAAMLDEAAAQGRTLAFILPAVLDLGAFQRQALAELVRESQRRSPALAVHYDDVDPCHRHLIQAFAEALWDCLAGSEIAPGRLGVVVVASGQGDAHARAGAYAVMRLLWEQLAVARGEVAFVRHPRPGVPEALAHCLGSPLHWVAAPMMLWD
jgi:sirohydrochlorin ferrochelatase